MTNQEQLAEELEGLHEIIDGLDADIRQLKIEKGIASDDGNIAKTDKLQKYINFILYRKSDALRRLRKVKSAIKKINIHTNNRKKG